MRKTVAAEQRHRRRDPRTREAVLEADRARHVRDRDKRLARYREYDRKRMASGTHYVRRYGVTAEEAAAAIAKRPDRCEICGRKLQLVFDHDTTTKRFRGWLCRTCNAGLGQFGDTLAGVEAAVAYLSRKI